MTRHVSGFYYQPFERTTPPADGTPLLQPAGAPDWRVRFCPDRAGAWRYTIHATDRSGTVDSAAGTVAVTASEHPGFIQRDPAHARYFAYQNGAPFVPVGQNLQNDWQVYRHSRLLAEAGANAARAWTFCHWTWLEWSFKPDVSWAKPGHAMHSYGGAGRYNQRSAWIVDHHLSAWERDGLRIMMCLGNGNELADPDNWGGWGGQSVQRRNGGWLATGDEFWTDARARDSLP